MVVHDRVYDIAVAVAEEKEITIKEAVRDVFRESGYEV